MEAVVAVLVAVQDAVFHGPRHRILRPFGGDVVHLGTGLLRDVLLPEEERLRVYGLAVDLQLEMEMRPGGVPGGSHLPDHLAGCDGIAHLYRDAPVRQVVVFRYHPVPVVDGHPIAGRADGVKALHSVPHVGDGAVPGGADGGQRTVSPPQGEIDALVSLAAFPRHGIGAVAKGRGDAIGCPLRQNGQHG